MAGFYENLMASTNTNQYLPASKPIFGNAATTPAVVASSQANIDNLRSQVENYQKQLNTAQQAYDDYVAQTKGGKNGKNGNNTNSRNEKLLNVLSKSYILGNQNKSKNQSSTYTVPDYTSEYTKRINDAQNNLFDAQNTLNDALNRQASQIASGSNAVQQGLVAKAAEEQGLDSAMRAYQTAMGNEAVRNAIMNGAIGTVGNFGGGK